MWQWGKKREVSRQQGIAGISECSGGLALVQIVQPGKEVPRLKSWRFVAGTDDEVVGRELRETVRESALGGARSVGVLAPGSYHLLQIEMPEVPEAEANQAIRWLIKDLLDFPLDEAVVDHFPVPGANLARSRLGYAVAARTGTVRRLASHLQGARLRVAAVDIPEMALHRLACRLPEREQGIALLYPGRRQTLITVSRRDTLFLTRTVGIGTADLAARGGAGEEGGDFQDLFAPLVLEIQRSLDFYESHFGQTPVASLAVAPTTEIPVAGLLPYLRGSLAIPVRTFDLGEILADCPLSPEEQARSLLAIGAALSAEPT